MMGFSRPHHCKVIRAIKAKAPAVPFRHFPCRKALSHTTSSDTQISQTKGSFLNHSPTAGTSLLHTVPIVPPELFTTPSTTAASQNHSTWVLIYPVTASQLPSFLPNRAPLQLGWRTQLGCSL